MRTLDVGDEPLRVRLRAEMASARRYFRHAAGTHQNMSAAAAFAPAVQYGRCEKINSMGT